MQELKFTQATLLAVVLWVITGLGAGMAANEGPGSKPQFQTGEEKEFQLVIEHVYFFRVSKYLPPAEITPLKSPAEASYKMPESALISNISAMIAGDYDWFLQTFTPEAQVWMQNWNEERGYSGEWWAEQWRKYFAGKQIILDERTETGDFVMITYFVHSPETGKKDKQPRIFKKTKEGKWLATRELPPDDPVLTTPWPWPEGQTTRRERRVIRR